MNLGFLSFSGILFGLLLRKIAKEEIKPGKKYFSVLMKICLIIISLILMYNFKISWTILIGILLAYFIPFNYLFLSLSFIIINDFLLFIILFIFGLPYGTLIKDNKKILKELILYLIPIILLINNLNLTFGREIASLCVGFLLTKTIKWK